MDVLNQGNLVTQPADNHPHLQWRATRSKPRLLGILSKHVATHNPRRTFEQFLLTEPMRRKYRSEAMKLRGVAGFS